MRSPRAVFLGFLPAFALVAPAFGQAPPATQPPDAPTPDSGRPTPPSGSPQITLTSPLASAPAVGLRRDDVGSKVSERFVMPSGYAEVGGELAFVTSGAIVTPHKLAFGDLALFRPSARRSFSDKLELSCGTTFLAKEPSGGGPGSTKSCSAAKSSSVKTRAPAGSA